MVYRRVIPCLDIKNGRVVKGVQFVNLRDAGDPVACAQSYDRAGADEICLLDITATHDDRQIIRDLVTAVADTISVPFTVGGGIRSVDDIRDILRGGADKVSINSAAVKNPDIVREAAHTFGRQCIVAAIDAKRTGVDSAGRGTYEIYTAGGRHATGIDAVAYAEQIVAAGAGELLVTSMDADGSQQGYAIELLQRITQAVNVPVIASGGVGTLDHFVDGAVQGGAHGLLAASVFHFGTFSIAEVKAALATAGVPVRPIDGGAFITDSPSLGAVLAQLEQTIAVRAASGNAEDSYTARLLARGMNKVAQKVGEEAVETVIAALAEDDTAFANESADLLYHLLVLWRARGLTSSDIARVLNNRS